MRILVDYRPALRSRSGVGEYVHQMVRELARRYSDDVLTLFTSSWKDRPDPRLGEDVPGARVSDHRLPVAALNFAWHRFLWPPVEMIARGRYDLAFSPHPLLLPARRAAQVVMVHDLDFLRHPERTQREIQRDYPCLAGPHARRAHRVIVPSAYTAGEVARELRVPRERVAICPPGIPDWRDPVIGRPAPGGYVLFLGSLEPRKNLDGLLDAYGRWLARRPIAPRLVVAGRAGPESQSCLDRMAQPPLRGRVDYLGYVREDERQRVYAGASVLVVPSHEEGFGMPALEAMSLGVPVIAASRGALPEVVGDAGLLIEPRDTESLVSALDRLLVETGLAEKLGRRGLERSARFRWSSTADAVRAAFQEAVEDARCRA